MELAPFVPKKFVEILFVPPGIFTITLPRFVFGAMLLKEAWNCAIVLPGMSAGHVMVLPVQVHGAKRVLSMQLVSWGLMMVTFA